MGRARTKRLQPSLQYIHLLKGIVRIYLSFRVDPYDTLSAVSSTPTLSSIIHIIATPYTFAEIDPYVSERSSCSGVTLFFIDVTYHTNVRYYLTYHIKKNYLKTGLFIVEFTKQTFVPQRLLQETLYSPGFGMTLEL